MREIPLTLPEIALIGSTRFAFGAGLSLLLADKFDDKVRKGIGWGLIAMGVLSSVPLAMMVIPKLHAPREIHAPEKQAA